ncbi:MAG: biotin transporter BioY [Clostridia bacterium]|nr:biotin transporter BioY [Clostridia bacterium]
MKKIRNIAYISLFAALMCVGAFICVPTTPPFTMQSFFIFLAILLLGTSRSFIALLVYVLLGLVGLPVFSSFQGGIGMLLSPSGGFIIGFLFIPAVFAFSLRLIKLNAFVSGIISLVVLYTVSVIWLILIGGIGFSQSSISTAFMTCGMPFIIPDLLKLTLAIFIHKRIKGWIKL